MNSKINSLTDDQAQHALLKFYDSLPADFWKGQKPTYGDIEFLFQEVEEEVEEESEVATFIEAVKDESDSEARGETSRALLTLFAEQETLQPYVEQAVEEAKVPHMATLPTIIIAATVVLAALPKQIDKEDGKISVKFGHLEDAKDILVAITNGFFEHIGNLPFMKMKK